MLCRRSGGSRTKASSRSTSRSRGTGSTRRSRSAGRSPRTRPPPPFVLVLRGPLGVGKTTVARELARRLGAEVVAIDDVLEEGGFEEWDADRVSLRSFLRANDVVVDRVARSRILGRATIVEGNFYWAEQIEDLLGRLPVPALVVRLTAPLKACITRDAGRPRTPPGESPRAGHALGEQAAREVYSLVEAVPLGVPVDASGGVRDTAAAVAGVLGRWRAEKAGRAGTQFD